MVLLNQDVPAKSNRSDRAFQNQVAIFANQYQHFDRVPYMTTYDDTRVQYGCCRNRVVYPRMVPVVRLFSTSLP